MTYPRHIPANDSRSAPVGRVHRRAIASVVCSLLIGASLLAPLRARAATATLQLELLARVVRGDGSHTLLTVADGGVLRTGDQVQFRVRSASDAYVYIVAYGSSGSAVLVHPFSGAPKTAFVAAGGERIFPDPTVRLPLDQRAGRELFLAIASPTPLTHPSSLLVRIEGARGDSQKIADIVAREATTFAAVSVRHLGRQPLVGIASAELPRTNAPSLADLTVPGVAQPTPTRAVPKPPATLLPKDDPYREDEVLGGAGSKIKALTMGGEAAIAAKTAGSEASRASPSMADTPRHQKGATGFTATIGKWFGFGGDDTTKDHAGETASAPRAKSPAATVPQPDAVVAKGRTYALPAAEAAPNIDAAPALETDSLATSAPPTTVPPDAAGGLVAEQIIALDQSSPAVDTELSDSAPSRVPVTPPETAPSELAPRAATGGALAAVNELLPAAPQPSSSVEPAPGLTPPLVSDTHAATSPSRVVAPQSAESGLPPPSAPSEPAAVSDGAPKPGLLATLGSLLGGSDNSELGDSGVPAESGDGDSESPPATQAAALGGEVESAAAPAPMTAVEAESGAESGIESPASERKPAGTIQPGVAAEALVAPQPGKVGSEPRLGESDAAVGDGVAQAAAPTAADQSAVARPASGEGGLTGMLSGLFGSAPGGAEPGDASPESQAIGEPAATPDSTETETATNAQQPSAAETQSAPSTASTQAPAEPVVGEPTRVAAQPVQPLDDPGSNDSDTGGVVAGSAPTTGDATTSAERDTGVLGLLGGLFGGSQQDEPATESTPSRAPEAQAGAVPAPVTTPGLPEPQSLAAADAGANSEAQPQIEPRTNEATSLAPAASDEAKPDAARGGLMSMLGGLFGGNNEPDTSAPGSAAVQRNTPQATASTESGTGSSPERVSTVAPKAPSFQRIRGADSERVMIVAGTKAPEPAAPSGVLTGTGSKIKALLEGGSAESQGEPAPVSGVPAANADAPTTSEADVAVPGPDTVAAPNTNAVAGDESRGSVGGGAAVAVVAPDAVQAVLAGAAQAAVSEVSEAPIEPVAEVDLSAADNAAMAVVLVSTPLGAGAGALLDGQGHVLTLWHLVQGYSDVIVVFKALDGNEADSERAYRARVIKVNRFSDLALLQLDQRPSEAVSVRLTSKQTAQVGEIVHAIGQGSDGSWRHILGKVSQVRAGSSWYSGRRILHRGTVLRAKVLDDPGSAGAPLFNNRMELVGISAEGRARDGRLRAVSIDTIRRFLTPRAPDTAVAGG